MYEKGPTPEWTYGDSTDQKKETCHHIKRQGKSGSSRAEREYQHIAAALHVSRNTVARVATAAKHLLLSPTEWRQLAEPEFHQPLPSQRF